MLQELAIKNIAIIDQLKLSFSPRLNILSGETGAGKSIIIDAISLLLGGKDIPGAYPNPGGGGNSGGSL